MNKDIVHSLHWLATEQRILLKICMQLLCLLVVFQSLIMSHIICMDVLQWLLISQCIEFISLGLVVPIRNASGYFCELCHHTSGLADHGNLHSLPQGELVVPFVRTSKMQCRDFNCHLMFWGWELLWRVFLNRRFINVHLWPWYSLGAGFHNLCLRKHEFLAFYIWISVMWRYMRYDRTVILIQHTDYGLFCIIHTVR